MLVVPTLTIHLDRVVITKVLKKQKQLIKTVHLLHLCSLYNKELEDFRLFIVLTDFNRQNKKSLWSKNLPWKLFKILLP